MPVLTAKIEKQIECLNAKAQRLSGNYLTNTPKRQREKRDRDRKIADYRAHIHVLQYLQEKELGEGLTPLETALTTSAFYDTLLGRSQYVQYCREHGLSNSVYPAAWLGDDRKRLQKAGIMDEAALLSAISKFDDLRKKAVIQPSTKDIRIRELTYKAQMMQGGDIQFTPSALVAQMMSAADLDGSSRVLEPEAGSGHIADAVKKITANVDCVEVNYEFRELLKLKGYRLIGEDFLEIVPQPAYDAVLMNPPFSRECEHIRHAYDFLKPGGTLVTICSPHVSNSHFRKYIEFRDWLAKRPYSIQTLRNFRFEMTNVHFNFLVIHQES